VRCWMGPGARRGSRGLPEVTPIVPVPGELQFDDPAYLFEPKYDGFRGLLYVGPRHCWFHSKRCNTMTRFQDLAEQVGDEPRVRSAIVHGRSCRWTRKAGRSSGGCWLAAATCTTPPAICCRRTAGTCDLSRLPGGSSASSGLSHYHSGRTSTGRSLRSSQSEARSVISRSSWTGSSAT
jgi:hypothetical protein